MAMLREVLMRLANIGSVVVVGFFMIIDLYDLFAYVRRPGDYHFGSEVGGVRYYSPKYFIGSIILTIVIGLIGITVPWLMKSHRSTVVVRSGVAVVLIVLSFVLSNK